MMGAAFAEKFDILYGQPVRAGVCHCRYCQLRAGSAFGTLVYFSLEKLQLRSGNYPVSFQN